MRRIWLSTCALLLSASPLYLCSRAVSDSDLATYRQALAHFNRQEFTEAQAFAIKVRSLPQARLLLAKIAYFSGDYQTALREFQKLTTEQQNSAALLGLAKAHLALQQSQEALNVINRLLDIAPDSFEAWLLKGTIHEINNQIPEAFEAYKMAARFSQRVGFAHGKLGRLYQKASLNEKAEYHLRIERILRSESSTGEQKRPHTPDPTTI